MIFSVHTSGAKTSFTFFKNIKINDISALLISDGIRQCRRKSRRDIA